MRRSDHPPASMTAAEPSNLETRNGCRGALDRFRTRAGYSLSDAFGPLKDAKGLIKDIEFENVYDHVVSTFGLEMGEIAWLVFQTDECETLQGDLLNFVAALAATHDRRTLSSPCEQTLH